MNAFFARLRAASPAMWVALIGSALSFILVVYGQLTWLGDSPDATDYRRYKSFMMLDGALTFVVRAMLVAGLVSAAAVATRHVRTLVLIAAATLAVLAVYWATAWPIASLLADNSGRVFTYLDDVGMAFGVALFAGLGLVVLAARGPVVEAILALVGGAIITNLPLVGDGLANLLKEHRLLAIVIYSVSELVMIVGLAGLTGAILLRHPATPDPDVAARGLARAHRGLLIKAMLPLVLVAALLLGARSPGAIKYAILGSVLALAFAWVAIGAGALTLVRSRLDGLSASRLLVGAGLVMWWGILYLKQATELYKTLFEATGDFGDLSQRWTVAGPLAGAAGFMLLGWSIAAFAKARGDEQLATSAVARTIAVIAIDVTVVLVTSYLSTKQPGPGGVFAIVGAIGSIIGTLAFAKLFARAAALVETMPTLPRAAIVSKGDS